MSPHHRIGIVVMRILIKISTVHTSVDTDGNIKVNILFSFHLATSFSIILSYPTNSTVLYIVQLPMAQLKQLLSNPKHLAWLVQLLYTGYEGQEGNAPPQQKQGNGSLDVINELVTV